ncbi:MAG TPA: hypothetical protein VEO74_11295 [Thermoanaerobaculia bacterium]|nr:hypothetical protein [Thermoanaerobaculia bacterium]
MLDQLTIETFQPLVGSSFWIHVEGRKIELRLTKAMKVMESEAARLPRNPFSLFFLAPLLLEQKIFHVTHDAFTEPLDIFLVPIGQEPTGYSYEAVFT